MKNRFGQGGAGQQWGFGGQGFGGGGGFGGFNPLAAGLGGLGMGLGQLFGDYNNPSDAAMPYLEQISGKAGQYFNPYIQGGNWAMPLAQGQYSNLINDPGGMLNKIGAGYQKSPGYKFALDQALQGAGHAAAAGGMAGAPASQQESMKVATGLANQDYNNWLQQATGMYGRGLGGLEGFMGRGLNASTNMANLIAQQLAQQGNLAYAGQNAQNQQQGNMWGNIIGGGMQLLPYLMSL